MKQIKVTEDAADFRVGLEDSQKQCAEMLSSIEEKSTSLEQKLMNKINVMDAEFNANIQNSELKTCLLIIEKLNQRDKALKELFNEEMEKVKKKASEKMYRYFLRGGVVLMWQLRFVRVKATVAFTLLHCSHTLQFIL